MKNTKLQNPSLRKRKGFTLIELIVVIAILAILAAIAVPVFLNTLNNARIKADNASVRVIKSAVHLYQAESTESTYPTVDELLTYLEDVPDAQQTDFEFYYNPTTGEVECAKVSPGEGYEEVAAA